jgi:hypothetical protein
MYRTRRRQVNIRFALDPSQAQDDDSLRESLERIQTELVSARSLAEIIQRQA